MYVGVPKIILFLRFQGTVHDTFIAWPTKSRTLLSLEHIILLCTRCCTLRTTILFLL